MKKKNFFRRILAILLIVCSIILCFPTEKAYVAATSYTNAKEFYDSTGHTNGKHIEVSNGIVYFATQAKLAASNSNLRYTTLGFDVTLTGNETSVSFAVKRGGSLEEVPLSRVEKNGYEYLLYRISTENLYRLARATGNANVDTVLRASVLEVRMDAILSTMQDGKVHGNITENDSGGVNEQATVYHLKYASHLSEMKNIFSGHGFNSYIDIRDRLDNYQLSIMYNIGKGAKVGNGYSSGSFTSGGTTVYNMLYSSGSVVTEKHRVLEYLSLKNPSGIGLSKTGYHLESGKEWKKSNGTPFSTSATYMPKDIVAEVGYGNKGVILYANWKPNTYWIKYDSEGGFGTVADTQAKYDTTASLRTNTYVKTGYYLPLGAEWVDANGKTYANGQKISNLTDVNNGSFYLYANWQPVVVMVDLDKQKGSGGTDNFYEKYGVGFYSNENCTSSISKVTIPSRTGYNFLGYYSHIEGMGLQLLDSVGNFAVANTHFVDNTTAYADWEAKKFNVIFDKQGGQYGSDMTVATYDAVFPQADGPVRDGYSFKGYYTQPNGKGSQIYNEFMGTNVVYQHVTDITLYAYWMDEILPDVTLMVSNHNWTNQDVLLIAEMMDFGSGLSSVQLYQINDDGSLTLVNQALNLNGAKTKTLTFANNTEGIIRYKAVATDMSGNVAESYNVVYYDTTAPNGENIETEINENKFYFDIDITDINTGD